VGLQTALATLHPDDFAVVSGAGDLNRGSASAVSASNVVTGGYLVTFNKDVSGCAYIATIGDVGKVSRTRVRLQCIACLMWIGLVSKPTTAQVRRLIVPSIYPCPVRRRRSCTTTAEVAEMAAGTAARAT